MPCGEQLVVSIGNISRSTEQTLGERIQQKKERERIMKDIEQLERRMDKERSLNKQMYNKIKELRALLAATN